MAIFCQKCGHGLADNAKFCSSCGAPITGTDTGEGQAEQSGRGTAKRDLIIIASVVVVVVIGFFAFREAPQRPQPPQAQTPPANATQEPGHGSDVSMAMIEDLPTDYASLVQFGNTNMDSQQFALAAEAYRRALEIDGSSPDVRTDYGACLHSMGLPQRALEEFHQVRSTHPEHAIAHFNLGIVYYGLNQPDSAVFYWEEYLQLDPDGVASATAKQLIKELKS